MAFPSWEGMLTVGGETDLRLFLKIGRACYDEIISHFTRKNSIIRCLDFGIGCGRTARHFYRSLGKIELHGCGVDRHSIEWLYNNVPFIIPVNSNKTPPLSCENDYFDVIYSVSVFSHLNEQAFRDWICELARITVSGGKIIFTIHGNHALSVLQKRDNGASVGVNPEAFLGILDLYNKEGFSWMPQSTTSDDIDVGQYGISFVSHTRLNRLLPNNTRMTNHKPAAISNWQDIVVLENL